MTFRAARTIVAAMVVSMVFGLQSASCAAVQPIGYGADPAQVLDFYPAPGPGPHKLVVFVHGGGWVSGSKPGGARIYGPLNQAGYSVATIGYRLVPQTDVAGSVADVAKAVGYLLDHAQRFGIDPDRFALMGHSSGGHIVGLLGTDQTYLQRAGVDPKRLAAVIALDGVFDVSANLTHYPNETRREVFGTDPAQWARYSPVAYVAGMKTHPTFCILHEDTTERFMEQATLFETALRDHKENLMTAVAPGLRHGQLVQLFDANQPMAPFALKCLAASL